jgi:hypothetical protein
MLKFFLIFCICLVISDVTHIKTKQKGKYWKSYESKRSVKIIKNYKGHVVFICEKRNYRSSELPTNLKVRGFY